MSKRNPNGTFIKTPVGKKTEKMLEVESKLGRTLEKDFYEYHHIKKWGQKKISNRWGVGRNLIFDKSLRGRRRCWAQMLGLDVRRINDSNEINNIKRRKQCDICSEEVDSYDKAHWVARSDGGSDQSYNILNLCPNCHRKLDRGDEKETVIAKEVLLYREVKKIIESKYENESKQKLRKVCEAILNRKRL